MERLDYRSLDTVAAHRGLGRTVQGQVHKILHYKITSMEMGEVDRIVQQARRVEAALESKMQDTALNPGIRRALRCYRDSLAAWVDGAELDPFCRELLPGKVINGSQVSGTDLALILQAEQMGCQTGMIRDQDESIWLWHTEEDVDRMPGGRFDTLRIFSFCYQDALIDAFIYPDLLPGPSFGWVETRYVQAVDTLYVKDHPDNDAIPPNIATWVALCLGGKLPLSEIIQALNPYQAGYALSAVTRSADQVSGDNLEFSGDHWTEAQLPPEYGAYFFQVNLISDRSCTLSQKYETIGPEIETEMAARIDRTTAALQHFKAALDKRCFLHQLISSREGDEYAYVNKDVKAHFLCRMSLTGFEKWLGAGSANQEEELVSFL